MQHKKLIESEIDFNQTFRYITQAYEEIAVMKMRKVRDSVLSTRSYLAHLTEVFFELKRAKEKLSSAKSTLNKQQKPNKEIDIDRNKNLTIDKIARLPEIPASKVLRRDKTVSVLLSANTTLYGDLIKRIFDLFMQNVSRDNSEIIIVGRVGQRMYDEQSHKKPYIYFELPDVDIRLEDLKPVIYHMVKYQKIQVYYGKFESIVNQTVVSSNISGDQPFGYKEVAKDVKPQSSQGLHYLFEPDLDKILAFFEDLIASSLFRQTVHEAQLARWASRIMSMEKAQLNIDLAIKKLHFSRTKIQKQDENRRQLDRLAGLTLWRS
ncbi:hypothetical protein A2954_03460 [Candidatus Roizmanbacteria bacterium RIFCSPLOWO2_01_FULL_37_12]|uniref:ATP synthase gamma chain n=1 Tax=Candidatus Roizmanbacteria bacterium RIFCSPLOWO2_01_FULL_37_12 TaxID=1802056 RepID=A0A1F7IF98_9BACT|nr:MAG: hypothetical protein A3D76_01305 [Candidatus Roizmanbacteria bacterium RIFCSPHIGHO2_02_FULL_37_9b]OGK42024.1 MAG: hypothetical protein A2954_03460 [Candidatus Roizmanbacteria bacterium RIFCSPLOWO2_01_FULL_37_12]